jgi:hypothetical protein
MKILKFCILYVGLLLGITAGTHAQIIVENADTVWEPTVESSAFDPGPIEHRLIVENANTIYHNKISEIDQELLNRASEMPSRIRVNSAKTMFSLVLTPMNPAIAGFSATGSGTSVALTWTNQRADEFPNTLVVSSRKPILWMPETGLDYVAGDVIEGLNTVRYVGDADHTETPLNVGGLETGVMYHFAAFPFNAERNYGLGIYVSVKTEGKADSGIPRWDVNEDGIVNIFDLILVASHFGESTIPAAMSAMGISMSNREQIRDLIAELEALDNPPDGTQIVIDFLRSLLNPEPVITETKLFANYPNPFNPETWIPYQLAAETDVEIVIYNVDGHRIRTLQFGMQPSGAYIARDKAAYWDGRNGTGERVSSGAYFYHFRAGEYAETRKMLIVK